MGKNRVGCSVSNRSVSAVRKDEGKKLEEDIKKRIHNIATYLEDAPFDQKRIEKVKNGYKKN